MEGGRYRGKRRADETSAPTKNRRGVRESGNHRRRGPGGVNAEQLGMVALCTIVAILLMTCHVSSQWTGQSVGQQLWTAVFVTSDLPEEVVNLPRGD